MRRSRSWRVRGIEVEVALKVVVEAEVSTELVEGDRAEVGADGVSEAFVDRFKVVGGGAWPRAMS